MMETQHERAVTLLNQQLCEAHALIRGQQLALDEAQRQLAEMTQLLDDATRLHLCEQNDVRPKRSRA